VIAAKAAGADRVIVSGLARDRERLAIAKALGADRVVDVEEEDLEDTVRAVTAGMGVDVSIDTAGGPATLASAMKLTREGAVLFAAAPRVRPKASMSTICWRDD